MKKDTSTIVFVLVIVISLLAVLIYNVNLRAEKQWAMPKGTPMVKLTPTIEWNEPPMLAPTGIPMPMQVEPTVHPDLAPQNPSFQEVRFGEFGVVQWLTVVSDFPDGRQEVVIEVHFLDLTFFISFTVTPQPIRLPAGARV